MDKDKLPPIPTPVSQRWREFRIQILPFMVFLLVLSGIVYLWKTYVQPVGVIGYADTNLVNVTSLQDGIISEMFVERFQNVSTGDVIAVVVNTDPELIKAQVESVQADIKVLAARNDVDVQRTEQSYRQFQQDLISLRVVQAQDVGNWVLVSNDFVRAEKEFKDGILSPARFEAEKVKFDVLTIKITEQAKQIEDLRQSLTDLAERKKTGEPDPFADAVEKKARELEYMLKPSVLRAPISGMISQVLHIKGERILRGMPIVTINDPQTRRIIGYVRQPVTRVPTTNDSVTITTMSQHRQTARGQILRVGAQLEPINPALLAADTKRVEVGLPILVSVPPGIALVPGEYVNLVIDYAR
jgi:multidrug resistance efflux pump